MYRTLLNALLMLGSLGGLAGCASSPPVHFYTLDAVAARRADTQTAGPPVQIATVHVPATLDRSEMVHETTTDTVAFSDQHRWAAPLDRIIEGVLTEDLLRRLPAERVLAPQSPAPQQTMKIVVDLVRFGADPSGAVILEGRWSLLQAASGKLLQSHPLRFRAQPQGTDYASQAHAMSALVGRLADVIARSLDRPDSTAHRTEP